MGFLFFCRYVFGQIHNTSELSRSVRVSYAYRYYKILTLAELPVWWIACLAVIALWMGGGPKGECHRSTRSMETRRSDDLIDNCGWQTGWVIHAPHPEPGGQERSGVRNSPSHRGLIDNVHLFLNLGIVLVGWYKGCYKMLGTIVIIIHKICGREISGHQYCGITCVISCS